MYKYNENYILYNRLEDIISININTFEPICDNIHLLLSNKRFLTENLKTKALEEGYTVLSSE